MLMNKVIVNTAAYLRGEQDLEFGVQIFTQLHAAELKRVGKTSAPGVLE